MKPIIFSTTLANRLSFAVSAAEESLLNQSVTPLQPPVIEARDLLLKLKPVIDEYYSVKGEFPGQDIIDSGLIVAQLQGEYVAEIRFNAQAFYFQATLKTEGLESALAGKTLRLTFEPKTETWTCHPGSPQGLKPTDLPPECRP